MHISKKLIVNLLVIVCFVFCGTYTACASAKYTLTFATHATPDSFRGEAEMAYLKEVERLTDGQVSFKVFWGSSLMTGNEILKGVSDGVVDLGVVNINFFGKQLISNNALNTIQESSGGYAKMVEFFYRAYSQIPEFKQELAKYNNEFLAVYSTMSFTMVSTKPLSTISMIKGLKARSASRWQLPLLAELGAHPVSVPWGDCPMALQTNVIDAVLANIDAINMVKMEESAPNVLIFEEFFPSTPMLLTMNSKKFKQLPPDIQAKFYEASSTYQSKLVELYNKWYQAIRANQEKGGFTVVIASDDDYKIWQNLPGIEKNKQQWIDESTSGGMKDAKDFLDSVYSLFHTVKNEK